MTIEAAHAQVRLGDWGTDFRLDRIIFCAMTRSAADLRRVRDVLHNQGKRFHLRRLPRALRGGLHCFSDPIDCRHSERATIAQIAQKVRVFNGVAPEGSFRNARLPAERFDFLDQLFRGFGHVGPVCNRKFPIMQEEISYSPNLLEISYSVPMDRVRKLLLDKAQGDEGSLAEWSKAAGKNHAYLQQFIHRGSPRELPEAVRIAVAAKIGVDESELRSTGQKKLASGANFLVSKEFRFIPAYDQAASAGAGAFIQGEAIPLYSLSFRTDWLRTITSASDEDLFVLFADGDSMESTIRSGDSMLVDRTQTNPRKDGIFVFMWDGLLNVKRLTSNPKTKSITISSDNPAYDKFTGIKPNEIEVVGRVVWIGRKL
ncbi:MAG: helix-turn-helix transcriptional regulator [Xanthobacteraceae bacterium]|nr:helix-turn-helix transcriptional regulator [Xanthobacteraceae bacterium]